MSAFEEGYSSYDMRQGRGQQATMQRKLTFLLLSCAIICACLSLVPAVARADEPPSRIVSMNLCTDQLVMMLADRDSVISLSYAAADPAQSLVADQVGEIVLNKGLAEEIVPLAPDLIFSGSFTTSFSDQLLRDLGYKVIEAPLSENLDVVRSNIQLVADAIGKPDRGEAMVRDLDVSLRTFSERAPAPASGLVILPGGFTPGQKSIANEILSLAGLRNVTADLGVTYWTNITLESLLRAKPQVIIVDPQNRKSRALATQFLEHPALKTYLTSRILIEVPSKLWGCGTPFVAKALETIVTARQRTQNLRETNEH